MGSKCRKINIACIQMSMTIDNKKKNLEKALEKIEKAAKQRAQIILLPELFNTEYFPWWRDKKYFDYAEPMPGPTTEAISEVAKKYGTYIIAPFYEEEGPGIYYNSAALIGKKGELIGKQRKMHIPAIKSIEKYYFKPSEANYPIFNTDYARIGICICYDRLFPEVMRALTLNGAEIIFNPICGTIFPGVSTLDTRALENGVFIVAANRVGEEGGHRYSGASMVIDPEGITIERADDKEQILIKEIDVTRVREIRNKYPFLRDRRPEVYSPLLKTARYYEN